MWWDAFHFSSHHITSCCTSCPKLLQRTSIDWAGASVWRKVQHQWCGRSCSVHVCCVSCVVTVMTQNRSASKALLNTQHCLHFLWEKGKHLCFHCFLQFVLLLTKQNTAFSGCFGRNACICWQFWCMTNRTKYENQFGFIAPNHTVRFAFTTMKMMLPGRQTQICHILHFIKKLSRSIFCNCNFGQITHHKQTKMWQTGRKLQTNFYISYGSPMWTEREWRPLLPEPPEQETCHWI